MLLNINHPSAVYGYQMLRKAGYKFCGFDPLGPYEYIVLYNGRAALAEIITAEKLETLLTEAALYE
jgi:hypothetical protein